jgi:hypothetical protein
MSASLGQQKQITRQLRNLQIEVNELQVSNSDKLDVIVEKFNTLVEVLLEGLTFENVNTEALKINEGSFD